MPPGVTVTCQCSWEGYHLSLTVAEKVWIRTLSGIHVCAIWQQNCWAINSNLGRWKKWCIHYRQPINLFRNVSIKKKNTNLLRKVLHLDNIWFISRLIFSAFYLISWTFVLFVIFISSFFLFTPSVMHFLTLITTSAPRACFSKLRESRLQITIQVCAASQPEI